MTDPTDLTAYSNAKAEPDADCITRDQYGRPFYTFLLEYQLGDKRYGTQISAYTEAEAERHVEAMRQSLTYTGKLFSRIET